MDPAFKQAIFLGKKTCNRTLHLEHPGRYNHTGAQGGLDGALKPFSNNHCSTLQNSIDSLGYITSACPVRKTSIPAGTF